MIDQLPTLSKFLKQLQAIPYLASKNLYRVADHFMALEDERFSHFMRTLEELHKGIVRCSTCCVWKEVDRGCVFCDSPKRDQKTVCVVETWHDLCAVERASGFHGVYHVLGGALSPLDGIGPERLTIDLLVKRLQGDCNELILAMNQTPEGEATIALIMKKIEKCPVSLVTCLARGIPVGSTLDAMDRLTVGKALAERRKF